MGMLVAALVLFMFAITIKKTEGACCGDYSGLCNDCTKSTPYCGYRQCNIFGCNCGGGCRSGCSNTWWGCTCWRKRRSIAASTVDPKDVFDQYDSNKDGNINKDEFHNWFDETELTDTEFKKVDGDSNGFITIDELDHDALKRQN